MVNGRYPFKSAWGIRRVKKGIPFGMTRNVPRNPPNEYEMWNNWFWGSDNIIAGFGRIKRWTGTEWKVSTNIKIRWF